MTHPAPAFCKCRDCTVHMLALRCPATSEDDHQCGDYKGHRGMHTILVATVFTQAATRLADISTPTKGNP